MCFITYLSCQAAVEEAVEESPAPAEEGEEKAEEAVEKKKKTNIIKRLSQRGLKKLRKVGAPSSAPLAARLRPRHYAGLLVAAPTIAP